MFRICLVLIVLYIVSHKSAQAQDLALLQEEEKPLYGQMQTPLKIEKQRKQGLKVTVLSLFSGSIKLTYERLIIPKQSLEVSLGYIGFGYDKNNKAYSGYLARLAYKFIYPFQNTQALAGLYIKPELAYSNYEYDSHPESMPDIVKREHVSRLAIMAVGGYQFIFKGFMLDLFAGLGVGVGDAKGSNYHHGYIGFNCDSHMAFTAGFKLGYAF